MRPEHLKAAIAVWEYAEASARYIFGDRMRRSGGGQDHQRRNCGAKPDGLTRTEISTLFGRQLSRRQDHGRARHAPVGSTCCAFTMTTPGGRRAERWTFIRLIRFFRKGR